MGVSELHSMNELNVLLVGVLAYWCLCLALRRFFPGAPAPTHWQRLAFICFGLLVLANILIGQAAFSVMEMTEELHAARMWVLLFSVTGTLSVVIFAAHFALGGFKILLAPLLLIPEPRMRQALTAILGSNLRRADIWIVWLIMAAFGVSIIGSACFLLWVVMEPLPKDPNVIVSPASAQRVTGVQR